MMDFSTVKGLRIPEGAVTQITDSAGRVLWVLAADIGAIRLQVQKFTSDTYAGETTYENEQFILLDIYPKTNGTVTVTYGGITKTITDTSGAAEPNAQQVVFGTFNGVDHNAEVPESGALVIEGDCRGFGQGSFSYSSKLTEVCSCITDIHDFGEIEYIPASAFESALLTGVEIPSNITTLNESTFESCGNLTSVALPGGLTVIGKDCFRSCTKLTEINLPNTIESIGICAFFGCEALVSIVLPDLLKILEVSTFYGCKNLASVELPNSLEIIRSTAFAGCKLDTIDIPASVTSIGSEAFSSLRTAIMHSTTPPQLEGTTDEESGTITYDTFDSKYFLKQIIVPKGCGEAYRTAAGWSTYADYIVEES